MLTLMELFRRTHKPNECEVAAIVERAWIDNVENFPIKQLHNSMAPIARNAFYGSVAAYVRKHFTDKGCYPSGYHAIPMYSGHVYFGVRARAA